MYDDDDDDFEPDHDLEQAAWAEYEQGIVEAFDRCKRGVGSEADWATLAFALRLPDNEAPNPFAQRDLCFGEHLGMYGPVPHVQTEDLDLPF